MPTVKCPTCLAVFAIAPDPEIGQLVVCPQCDTQLIIVWLYPLEVDFVDEILESKSDLDGKTIKKKDLFHQLKKD